MSTQHTPWKLWNGYGPLPDGRYAVGRIGPDGGQFDGLVCDGDDIIGTKEDLEYVVIACNSHAPLLAAAEAALWWMAQLDHDFDNDERKVYGNLQAAIKQAKEGAE